MTHGKKISISRNLTISLVGVIFILSASIIVFNSYNLNQKEKLRLQQQADDFLDSIVSTLEISLWDLDRENINNVCTYYFSNEKIVQLRLTGASGEVLFEEEKDLEVKTDKLITRSSDIIHNGEFIGKVDLAISPFRVNQIRSELLKASLSALLITSIALMVFTSFLLRKFLREPMEYLSKIATSYSQGNYHPPSGSDTYVEFEPLVSVLVDMGRTIDSQMSRLQQAEASLRKHRDNLEEMVKQRTIELEQANRDLQREVQDRIAVQENLKTNEQRLKAILRASPIGIGLVIDRMFDWTNKPMEQMLGWEKDELIGKSVRNFYPSLEEYERVGLEIYQNAAKSDTGSVETQMVRMDGSIFDCIISACFLDKADPAKGLIVAIVDISESKAMETKLRQAKKMEAVGTLAGGVAHDLNNILSGIVSYPELLLTEIPDESPLVQPMQTIQKSGEKAVRIVQDLLTMARRGVVISEVVNLKDIIAEQVNSPEMKKLLQFHRHVEVVTDLEPRLLNVKGSSTHLSKTIMNLISNAAEAMPEGGKISITARNIHLDTPLGGYETIKEGDYVEITVSDTGIGMTDNDQDKIFEPFYTKKKMGRSGTGLGMAVVWGTIKDHDGYIDLQSTEGEGSIFRLYFPVTREDLEKAPTDIALEEYFGSRESILVVDDVVEQREIASAILEKLGYLVSAVASGEAAVQFLKTNQVDLVILDMIMSPGMDGLETYREICTFRPRQKAIIASGFSKTDKVKELQELGVSQYLKKPYTLAKIGAAVKAELQSGQS